MHYNNQNVLVIWNSADYIQSLENRNLDFFCKQQHTAHEYESKFLLIFFFHNTWSNMLHSLCGKLAVICFTTNKAVLQYQYLLYTPSIPLISLHLTGFCSAEWVIKTGLIGGRTGYNYRFWRSGSLANVKISMEWRE